MQNTQNMHLIHKEWVVVDNGDEGNIDTYESIFG